MTFEYDTKRGHQKKFVGRVCVYFLMFVIPLLIGFAILKLIDQVYGKPSDYLVYLFWCLIPWGINGFICFAFGDNICLKFGLYDTFRKTYTTRSTTENVIAVSLRNDSTWE